MSTFDCLSKVFAHCSVEAKMYRDYYLGLQKSCSFTGFGYMFWGRPTADCIWVTRSRDLGRAPFGINAGEFKGIKTYLYQYEAEYTKYESISLPILEKSRQLPNIGLIKGNVSDLRPTHFENFCYSFLGNWRLIFVDTFYLMPNLVKVT